MAAMAAHPIYAGDMTIHFTTRPCAARGAEGSCEEAATSIGVKPNSSWTSPHKGSYGWACSAHEHVMMGKYEPERVAAQNAQLAQEGREFWATYGEESGETPRVSRRMSELDSLNSDTR